MYHQGLILFFPFFSVAENVIPKKFHGTWSNDCSKEQDVFIFTESGYFNLYKSQDEIDEYTYFYLQLTDSTSYEDWTSVDGDIFDFKKEIYGKRIKVEFVEKIRDEKKFNDIKELLNQITLDITIAKDKLNYGN